MLQGIHSVENLAEFFFSWGQSAQEAWPLLRQKSNNSSQCSTLLCRATSTNWMAAFQFQNTGVTLRITPYVHLVHIINFVQHQMVLTENFCQQIKNICDSNFIHAHGLRMYPLAFSKRCLDVSLKKPRSQSTPAISSLLLNGFEESFCKACKPNFLFILWWNQTATPSLNIVDLLGFLFRSKNTLISAHLSWYHASRVNPFLLYMALQCCMWDPKLLRHHQISHWTTDDSLNCISHRVKRPGLGIGNSFPLPKSFQNIALLGAEKIYEA